MRTLIIAEAGVNHNGSLSIAKRLIEAAAEAGADFIKFQSFVSENIVSKNSMLADYQKRNLKEVNSQFDMLKKLELNIEDHYELMEYSNRCKIAFLSTAFDLDSVDLLAKLELPLWKIPSGEITNKPYLQKIGSFNSSLILSTGMATLGEIEAAIGVLEKSGTQRDKIIVLHCTTEYPAPLNEVNLNAMMTMGDSFKVNVGYSDHTEGFEISFAAVALGATVIEKHFTLDRNMEGPDHKASLEPDQLKKMIEGIRNIERAMGNGIKTPTPSEIGNKLAARKSIVAAEQIRCGDFFTEVNLAVKRPGSGVSPMLWNEVVGMRAKRDYQPDELIEL